MPFQYSAAIAAVRAGRSVRQPLPEMKRIAIGLALVALLGSGCISKPPHESRYRTPPTLSNAQAYDRFVVRRADELASSGKYTRDQAGRIAEKEAAERYGTRTTGGSATTYGSSWSWGRRKSEPLSFAELDAAVAEMKRTAR